MLIIATQGRDGEPGQAGVKGQQGQMVSATLPLSHYGSQLITLLWPNAVSERVIRWAQNRFSMADKNRFPDELSDGKVTTLVENATSKSDLEESF